MTTTEHVPRGTTADDAITKEELQLAARNHGMPLEALRYDVTPLGLHYLLIHYDIPDLDPAAWRLQIDGLVERPLTLSLDDLTAREHVTRRVTMECAGNGRARLSPRALSQPWLHEAVGTGEWTGTPAAPLLDEAGLSDDAVEVVFTGADEGVEGGVEQPYARSLTREQLADSDALLVWALNGVPLLPQHGAPVRLLVPRWYGMTSVKWLERIEAVDTPFEGYQQARAYRYRQTPDEPGEPVTTQAVRSLMTPPGKPDFFTRRRIASAGRLELQGRAWSGAGAIARVEVSADGGGTWWDADLDPPDDPAAWTGWHTTWDAAPGGYELCCRATDDAGRTQPLAADWNLGGYAVNAVHRVPITVS